MRGLYKKFNVSRTDGKSKKGEKHHRCRYFSIDIDCDEHAVDAMLPYAAAIEKSNPILAKDIRDALSESIIKRQWPSN